MGQDAPGAIQPDFMGKIIEISLSGWFFFSQPDTPVEVRMDRVIPWQVISQTAQEILVRIDTAGIPDFYLSGAHPVVVSFDGQELRTSFKVGPPTRVVALSPELQSVTVVRDAQGEPQSLQVEGLLLMDNPAFAQFKLDGVIVRPTAQSKQNAITRVSLPIENPASFSALTSHNLIYTSPFGFTQSRF